MLTLDDVKKNLRIDGDSDDDVLERLMTFAASYCRNAIDDFDTRYSANSDYAVLADNLMLVIISERYEDRGNVQWKPDSTTTIMIQQLQNSTLGVTTNG